MKRGVDEPAPVLVTKPSSSNSCLTSAKNAISMANEIRVNIAAKNATKDVRRIMKPRVENSAKKNAMNVAMVATCKKKNPLDKSKTWHES